MSNQPNHCIDVGVNRSHPLYSAAIEAIYQLFVRRQWTAAPGERLEPAATLVGQDREFLGAGATREERVCTWLYITTSQYPDHLPSEHTQFNPYNYRDPVGFAQWIGILPCSREPTPLPNWVQGGGRAVRIPQGTLTGSAPGRVGTYGYGFWDNAPPPLPRTDPPPIEPWDTPTWSPPPQLVATRGCAQRWTHDGPTPVLLSAAPPPGAGTGTGDGSGSGQQPAPTADPMAKAWAWVQKNPLPAAGIGFGALWLLTRR